MFDLIKQQPERRHQVTGIGAKRAVRIIAGRAEQRVVREIMLFLHAHGVGTSRAVRIYKTYGADAVQVISDNPYRLARDIRGIGFRTADQIAARLGIEPAAMIRVRAGISYALAEAMDEGHCGLPVVKLVERAAKLLDVPANLIEAALKQELAAGEVIASTVDDRACVFLAGLVLAESQALRLALSSKVLGITGRPGVGKTTLVNAILTVLRARQVEVAVCAPTGRAAKRLSESTGLAAKTIHRLLETNPRTGGFRRGEVHPLDCDLLVINETSMVDVLLIRSLLRALPDTAALLIIGDVDQLPSVGPGQVLADIIGSQVVPAVRLTEVFRQAAQSRVIVNAHWINQGLMPELSAVEGPDFYFVDAADPDEALRKLVTIVRDRIPARFGLDPIRDVQVLCPMNRGGLGPPATR